MIRIGDYVRFKDDLKSWDFYSPALFKVIGMTFTTDKSADLILDKPYHIVKYTNKYGKACETRLDKIQPIHVELCTKEIRNKKLKEIFDD